MSETPTHDCFMSATHERTLVEPGAVPEMDWDQFDTCERCQGHAPIEETPDGDLCCKLCHAKLPRPSS
jgi:hypothetical protein